MQTIATEKIETGIRMERGIENCIGAERETVTYTEVEKYIEIET